MHTVKLAIRLVRKHTINNGTMSIKMMLDILDIWYYEPAGAYQAPKEFTSPEMSFQIHLKHQTQQKICSNYSYSKYSLSSHVTGRVTSVEVSSS